jgi:hypothetical protein
MLVFAAVAVALSSCARCAPSSTSTPDAGAANAARVPDAGRPHVKHSVDLRTALLVAYPEYRGTTILDGRVALKRTYEALPEDAWAQSVKANGFVEVDGGFTRTPFLLERPAPNVAVLSMRVDGEVIGKVLEAPMPLSSMDMGLFLPRGLPVAFESYELFLHYGATPHQRAGFLTRQVVELLLRNGQWTLEATPEGWGPQPDDGGLGEVPEHFTVTLKEVGRPATLKVQRDAGEVRLTYSLVTDAP